MVRLRRIANNKPDVARLRELRESLRAFESVPLLPAGVRKKRDESVDGLTDATDQIRVLTNHISDRTERIGALHIESALQTYANEIGELNSETNDYHRSVNDRPKRVNERSQAMGRAEAEWRRIWTGHPIADAEKLRAPYSKKREIFTLIKDHARLCAESEQAHEQARTVNEDQDRLREELNQHPDPGDPVRLIAAIGQAKSLGDVDQAIARLKSEIERLDASANRDLKKLRGWSGNIEDLETGTMPSPVTIDRYSVEWSRITDAKRGLRSRLLENSERISANQIERDRLGRTSVESARANWLRFAASATDSGSLSTRRRLSGRYPPRRHSGSPANLPRWQTNFVCEFAPPMRLRMPGSRTRRMWRFTTGW